MTNKDSALTPKGGGKPCEAFKNMIQFQDIVQDIN